MAQLVWGSGDPPATQGALSTNLLSFLAIFSTLVFHTCFWVRSQTLHSGFHALRCALLRRRTESCLTTCHVNGRHFLAVAAASPSGTSGNPQD